MYSRTSSDVDILMSSFDLSFPKVIELAQKLFESIDSPVALSCSLMLKYGEYGQYLEKDINPMHYTDAYRFRRDYQCTKLLSKYTGFTGVYDTKRRAISEFLRCENKCRSFNRRVRLYGFMNSLEFTQRRIFVRAREIVETLMGRLPRLDELQYEFGPGSNVGLKGNKTSALDKLSAVPSITPDLLSEVRSITPRYPAWDSSRCSADESCYVSPLGWNVVPGSKLTFVPKNAKIDRPICVEPLYNSFVQKGIGTYLRKRLKKFGIDLSDQSANQELARISSSHELLATIDLKSASDLISFELVREMIPYDWFYLLCAVRSPYFTYPEEGQTELRSYPFAKFSSMGNGFTFELETVLFYSIAKACQEIVDPGCPLVTKVYGDDIVAPSHIYDTLCACLETAGFEVNRAKSFSCGPFRESCGRDYFLGCNVRPFFLKDGSVQSLYNMHNFFVAFGNLDSFRKSVYQSIPKPVRVWGPYSESNTHLFSLGFKMKSSYRHRDPQGRLTGSEGFFIKTLVAKAIALSAENKNATLAYALYKGAYYVRPTLPSGSEQTGRHTRRDGIRYRIQRTLVRAQAEPAPEYL